jgi:hypothetical protein
VTCNEIQHLFAAVVAMPTGDVGNRLRWSDGDDDISHAPAPATTDDKPPSNHEHHDLRLEY